MDKEIIVKDITIGSGPGLVSVNLRFNALLSMDETEAFVKWCKKYGLEKLTASKFPEYLSHWREGVELGIYDR